MRRLQSSRIMLEVPTNHERNMPWRVGVKEMKSYFLPEEHVHLRLQPLIPEQLELIRKAFLAGKAFKLFVPSEGEKPYLLKIRRFEPLDVSLHPTATYKLVDLIGTVVKKI